jgi:retinoid hydroxylase
VSERFDPESPWRLTPSGKQRQPSSYIPFLGGKRVCLGKTFAENAFKTIMPLILNEFEFEFIDKEDSIMENKKHNNAIAFNRP